MSSSISLRISAFIFSRLVTSRFTSCLKGIFRSPGRSFSMAQFIANDGLGDTGPGRRACLPRPAIRSPGGWPRRHREREQERVHPQERCARKLHCKKTHVIILFHPEFGIRSSRGFARIIGASRQLSSAWPASRPRPRFLRRGPGIAEGGRTSRVVRPREPTLHSYRAGHHECQSGDRCEAHMNWRMVVSGRSRARINRTLLAHRLFGKAPCIKRLRRFSGSTS